MAVVLGKIGCFTGLFVVYILPIATYLQKLKNEVDQISKENNKAVGPIVGTPLIPSTKVNNISDFKKY